MMVIHVIKSEKFWLKFLFNITESFLIIYVIFMFITLFMLIMLIRLKMNLC